MFATTNEKHGILSWLANLPSNSIPVRIYQSMLVIIIGFFTDSCYQLYRAVKKRALNTREKLVEPDNTSLIRLFHAEKNFYLIFFTLFMLLVLIQFRHMSSEVIKAEALAKQANNAYEGYKTLLNTNSNAETSLKKAIEDKRKAEANLEAMRRQSANLQEEYERLQKEIQSDQNRRADKKND
ncbi:uncharacterized protein LOC135144912 isoform X2 [Zophobas morio]|uniref:uncharacterized protein LOC135144912 isoform X2 n=1 Tax=Zophobas morio TaxID=2755281 RepID=UPI003083BC61